MFHLRNVCKKAKLTFSVPQSDQSMAGVPEKIISMLFKLCSLNSKMKSSFTLSIWITYRHVGVIELLYVWLNYLK